MPAPALVAHADWSVHPQKRWMAAAKLRAGGYLAEGPAPVGPLDGFWAGLAATAGGNGPILVGFDFPIGLPAAYAKRAGISGFLEALGRFDERFYEVATAAEEISLARPFYPRRPGGRSRLQLLDGLELETWDLLHRRCDRRTRHRPAACPMFWTLGGNQVGRAALNGWRHLLAPARQGGAEVAIWPFEGALGDLLDAHRFVVAETYPGEEYGHLGLDLRRHGGKRRRAARAANAARMLDWAERSGIALAPALAAEITDGFGPHQGGDDRFDAVVGLFGLLNVLSGARSSGEPADPMVQRIEGWILGLDAAETAPEGPRAGSDRTGGDNGRRGVL
jgi:hypothetical protein